MTINYIPKGICARRIDIEIEDGIVVDASFVGGCDGNHKGIVSLIKGMKAEDVIARLENIKCGMRNTSCPAQLAQALKENL